MKPSVSLSRGSTRELCWMRGDLGVPSPTESPSASRFLPVKWGFTFMMNFNLFMSLLRNTFLLHLWVMFITECGGGVLGWECVGGLERSSQNINSQG